MHSRPCGYSSRGDERFYDSSKELYYSVSFDVPLEKLEPEAIGSRSSMSEGESPIIQPHENDVLMGRGGKNNQHSGNEKLREMAREECENYSMSTKKGKSYISRQLVQQMRELTPAARFLKRNTDTGEWEDVGDDIAREKASQVLRDAVAVLTEEKPSKRPYKYEQTSRASLPASVELPDRSLPTHEPTPGLQSVASSSVASASFPPPTPIEASRKRRRYSTHPPLPHPGQPTSYSYEAYQSQPAVYSPTRRHHMDAHQYPTRVHSQSAQLSRPRHMTTRQMSNASSGSLLGALQGGLNEFDLFNGELLESDHEEEAKEENLPPEPNPDPF